MFKKHVVCCSLLLGGVVGALVGTFAGGMVSIALEDKNWIFMLAYPLGFIGAGAGFIIGTLLKGPAPKPIEREQTYAVANLSLRPSADASPSTLMRMGLPLPFEELSLREPITPLTPISQSRLLENIPERLETHNPSDPQPKMSPSV